MILTAVQQGKTLVRIITDKGTYYAAGVLQATPPPMSPLKPPKNPPRFGFATKKGQQCALSTLCANAKLNRLTAY